MRKAPVVAVIRLRLKTLPLSRAAEIDPRCLMEAVAMGTASGYRLAYEGDWPEHVTKEEAEEIRKIARM
ncbi:hypothetical protein HQ586_03545 [Candidatus Bathyarchaeota archaeon]|nr:hypothetical protein [Candidatus Bathyarchaeota archaeon]